MALDIAYWDTEVASFNRRLPSFDECHGKSVRMMLRGLAVIATELTREQPTTAEKVLADIHNCLRAVHDHGIELDIESWIWNHASPEIAASVAREFGIEVKT